LAGIWVQSIEERLSVKKNKGILDLQVDFFLPVWRRVAVVAVCALWSLIEFSAGSLLWGIVFIGLAVVATWQLFFDGWPE